MTYIRDFTGHILSHRKWLLRRIGLIIDIMAELMSRVSSQKGPFCRIPSMCYMRFLMTCKNLCMVISTYWSKIRMHYAKKLGIYFKCKKKHYLAKMNCPSEAWTTLADSSFVPSQWETALLCNDISHWLGANLESALCIRLKYMYMSIFLNEYVNSELHLIVMYPRGSNDFIVN